MPKLNGRWVLGIGCLLAVVGCDDKAVSAPDALVGFGNEPGWHVDIDREGMIFHDNYGQDITRFPYELPRRVEGGWEYTTSTPSGETLRIGVRERQCQDTMADATYPYSVTVLKDDNEYHGCGRLQTD